MVRPEWDGERRQPSSFQDSSNNSDEGERYDSDGEASEGNKGNVYKDNCDTLSMDSSKQKIDVKNNINSNTPSPSKLVKTVKKIDLGAAANFGGTSNNNKSNIDLFAVNDDDFNPRAADSQNEFGNFESAFPNSSTTSPPANTNTNAKRLVFEFLKSETLRGMNYSFVFCCSTDEFADFAFAFTDNNQVATQSNNNVNLFNNPGATSTLNQINFIQNALSSPPPMVKNSNADLLLGLQPTISNPVQSAAFKNPLEGGMSIVIFIYCLVVSC